MKDAGYRYSCSEESLLNSLENMGYIINESKDYATVTMLSGDLFIEAAAEIKRLHAEIKRLHSVVVLCPRCQENDNG